MENQRVRITKKMLTDSLLYWMQQKPIEHITVKEICEHAELNRSTFYLHYTDQYDLLTAVENIVISDTMECFASVSPDASTKQFIVTFLSHVQANQVLFQTTLCQPNRESFRKRFISESLVYLREGIGLTLGSEKEQYTLTFLLRGSLAIIQQWIESSFNMSIDSLADLIYRLCDNAIKGKL